MTGQQHGDVVVVLTALALEYQAVGARLEGLRPVAHERGTGFEVGSVPGTSVEVVVGRTGEGNVAAAVVAQRAIEVFRPRAVLLVGVAGALSDAVGLGDVVVATRVYAVHGGKEEGGRFYARPRAFEAGHALLNLAVRLDAGRAWQSEGLDGSADGFRVHFKPVASGEAVVNSREGSLADLVREHYNDAVAIEMESAGVAQAAHAAEVPMLTIRGISDRADGHKQVADAAGGQPRAAAHAATVATAVIRQWASSVPRRASLFGALSPAAGSAVVYNALPPDTTAFTGRREEIAWITAQAQAASAVGRVVAISALDGMPGVGKSALALHLAHRLSTRFPDRQLFVALHAHSEDRPPADPVLLLAGLLVGDGLDPRALPARLDELSALWRARMAGRRALLVLDDAASSAQVAPLLPGTGSCLVLVTSRRHLGDLPYAVYQLTLDVLPQAEAVAMFRRLAPRATRQGERAVLEVVQAAGRLPLAIALYAALYRKHPTWTLADLATEARTGGVMLAAEQRTLAAAFDLSYRTLPVARQRFFRRLGLHIGTDLDLYAAAALTGTDLAEARWHLDALLGDRLLTETAYHRYGMHDLIRAHARTLVAGDPQPEHDDALARLLHYYAHTAQRASILVSSYPRPEPDGPAPADAPLLHDPDAAHSWLHAESPNLHAAFSYSHGHALHDHVVALAAGLAEILVTDGPWTRAPEVHQAAAEIAGRTGHQAAYAIALADLGRARYQVGDFPGTSDAAARALEIFRALGNRPGQAGALRLLALVRLQAADFPAASDILAQALAIYRAISHRRGEANTLLHIGEVGIFTKDLLGVDDALTRALEIYRAIGDRDGEAKVLVNLGRARFMAGDFPGAGDAVAQALEIYHAIGHQHRDGAATALIESGRVRSQAGDHAGAIDAHTRALEIYRAIGDRGDEAWALNHCAAALVAAGQPAQALALYQQALVMNRELSKPDDEAISLEGIAEHHLSAGGARQGTARLRQALQIYQRLGLRADIERITTRLATLSKTSAPEVP